LDARANAVVVDVDDLKAVVVAVEDLVVAVYGVDVQATRVALSVTGDGAVATNLARTSTLKTHPKCVCVEVHIENRAIALDAGQRVDSKNLLDH